MRLAFAVAVHLSPEILVVDEVLAVGDAQFQKKCLEKMQQLSRSERTILFVSHNMAAVRQICHRGLVMEQGRLVDQGEVNEVVDRYLARLSLENPSSRETETPSFSVHRVEVTSEEGVVIKTFDNIRVTVHFTAKTDVLDPDLYVGFMTAENERLAGLDFKDFRALAPVRAGQTVQMGFAIESFPFMPGSYRLEVYLRDLALGKVEQVPGVVPFEVVESPVYGGRKTDHWFGRVGLKVEAVSSAGGGGGADGLGPSTGTKSLDEYEHAMRTSVPAENLPAAYLDLLKRCLTRTLFDDLYEPVPPGLRKGRVFRVLDSAPVGAR